MATRFDGNGPVLPLLFFLAPLVTSVLPRLTPLFLVFIGLTLVLPSLRGGLRLKQLIAPSAALAACLVLSLYVFVNALWAADQGNALSKAAVLLGAVLLVFAAAPTIATLDERQISRTATAFAAGAAIGAVYLLLELLSGGATTRAVVNSIAVLRPDQAKRAVIVASEVKYINMSVFNQNATLLMLHLWPGLLILSALKTLRRRLLSIVLFLMVLVGALLVSDHESSQIALLGSTLVLILARSWPRPVTRGLAALWCLGFVLVLPFNFFAYQAELHLAEPLPSSYKARVIIWEYTAERVLENPVFGIGVSSTAIMTRQAVDAAKLSTPEEQPEGFVYKRTTAHHAHNIFLQSWYELGAVGAVLLAIAGALIVLRIDLLPPQAQPFAAATFAAFALIASFAWGMWQTWFMCAIALVPLYLAVAAATAREATPT
ncbi:MAG: O-antigen ligase family protein [Methyloceanibacter sp.]